MNSATCQLDVGLLDDMQDTATAFRESKVDYVRPMVRSRAGSAPIRVFTIHTGLFSSPRIEVPSSVEPPSTWVDRADVLAGLDPTQQAQCRKRGMTKYIWIARGLIEEYFLEASGVQLEYEEDPEEPEDWYSLTVTVRGDLRAIHEHADALDRAWLERVPWPKCRKVRVLVNVEED